MAVEIKELVIRAVVEYPDTPPSTQQEVPSGQPGQGAAKSEAEIIQACVKEVMKILKRQKKR